MNVKVSEKYNHVAPKTEIEIEDNPIVAKENEVPKDN